jgi:2-polyprenyl-6-methoxyphenol hydroxylase-like FAD-dependent oxidoreductase
VTIQTGAEVVGATSRGELLLASGERIESDLAIGVDGIWSKVRTSIGVDFSHRVTREGCLRTIIPRKPDDLSPEDAGKYIENWNGTRRLLVTPISDSQFYLALTCPDDDVAARTLPVNRELWMAEFPDWSHLTERIGSDVTWGRYSIIECCTWSVGRTALVGDAAHAQPPNLGQGGGMAMQNGLALAVMMEDVTDRRDVPGRLKAWEQEVRPLTDHCQKWSTLYGEVAYLPDELRANVFLGASSDQWLAEQILLAANGMPLGTPERPRYRPST